MTEQNGPLTTLEIDALLLHALKERLLGRDEAAQKLEIFVMKLGGENFGWEWYVVHLLACARHYAANERRIDVLKVTLETAEALANDSPHLQLLVQVTRAYIASIQDDLEHATLHFLGAALLLDQHSAISPAVQSYADDHLARVQHYLYGAA